LISGCYVRRSTPESIERHESVISHRVISQQCQHFRRTWSEADINWQAKPADSIEK